MNYLLLSLCCMLVGLPLVQLDNPELDQTTRKFQCFDDVANFLREIKHELDNPSVQALFTKSEERNLDIERLIAGIYVPLKKADHLALKENGYPESCDRILDHFWKMVENVDCFTRESIGTLEDYKEILDYPVAKHVLVAGLLCNYLSKWTEGRSGESARLFDFTGSNKNIEDCISKTSVSLSEKPLDASQEQVKKLVKLTRQFEITVVDFAFAEAQPLDQGYLEALKAIDAREACRKFIKETNSIVGKLECYNKHIGNNLMATVKLSATQSAGDIVLAAHACNMRSSL